MKHYSDVLKQQDIMTSRLEVLKKKHTETGLFWHAYSFLLALQELQLQ